MLRSILLVLFLVGCAGNQSAFPTPPPFNPAMDAPITIGHPGTVAPRQPERSPHKRVLPQTPDSRREDGIWASDADDDGGPPFPIAHLLGIAWETLDNPSDYEAESALACAGTMRLAGGKELAALERLSDWPRACAMSRLYRHCAEGLTREAQRKRASGEEYDARVKDALKRLVDAAKRQEASTCKMTLPEWADAAVKAIAKRWTETHETVSQ